MLEVLVKERSAQPRDVVKRIAGGMPVILREVREVLAREHPHYAAFLDENLDEVLVAATNFVGRLFDGGGWEPGAAPFEAGAEQALFEEIGEAHCEQHQDIKGLLAAYRTGAAVAWRHISNAAVDSGMPTESVAGLANVVFMAMDQLSSASLRGYQRRLAKYARARERCRDELAQLLLSDRCDGASVHAAAERANWRLPNEAAVVLIEPPAAAERDHLARLDGNCLRLHRSGAQIAIVPDPAGPNRRARLRSALAGSGAVVGAPVALDRLPSTMRLVRLAADLRRAGVLDDDPLFVNDHLDALLVHSDETLLAALRREHLKPLDGLPPATRERMLLTLTSWLQHMGNRQLVAEDLHVHPQTVRYRMAQLRELFGPALRDPSRRAALQLALAWGPSAYDIARTEAHARS